MPAKTPNENPRQGDDYVTSIISVVVKPEFMHKHEQWIDRINDLTRQAPGFFSADIIKPKDHTQPEYVAVLKFDTYENLKNWQASEQRQRLYEEAREHIVHISDDQKGLGMEMWFSRPDNQAYFPKPAYYKQVLVALGVVYPLSTLLGMTLRPLLEPLPAPLQTFIIIAIMSCLMTWPVLPYVTRWMHGWLYPAPRQTQ